MGTVASAEQTSEQRVALSYLVAPELRDCPDVAEFRRLTAKQLGSDPFRADAILAVKVSVEPAETGLEGAIEWSTPTSDRGGERHFALPNRHCHDLVETMSFVLAVQLQLMADESQEGAPLPADRTDENGGAITSNQGAAATKSSSAYGKKPGASDTSKPPPPARSSSRAIVVGAGPSVGFGLGPSPVAQGRLFVALELDRMTVELGGEMALRSTTRLDDRGGFYHGIVLSTLAACSRLGGLAACATAKLGRLHVEGFGIDRPEKPSGLLAQAGTRLQYSLRLGNSLVLSGHGDASYLLTPWTVDLNHVAAWTMPRLSAVVGIDTAVRFP